MMSVIVKFGKIKVYVSEKNCINYTCFSPHQYEHYGTTIDGEKNNWVDKHYSCSHRNYHGCPEIRKEK